jgi:hypothetical protein
MYQEYEDGVNYNSRSNSKRRQFKYNLGKKGPHVANKNEADMLRKIMAESGLGEVEVRDVYKYRKMLSDAAKQTGDKDDKLRRAINLLKNVLREYKLPKEHPNVKKLFFDKAKERQDEAMWPNLYVFTVGHFESALKNYKKK